MESKVVYSLYHALAVLRYDTKISAFLKDNDPMAYKQASDALKLGREYIMNALETEKPSPTVLTAILDAKILEAETKAQKSQAACKYIMYGYWKAIAVHFRKVKREFMKGVK